MNTIRIGKYTIKTSQEQFDSSRKDGIKKRQYRIRVIKDNGYQKSSYYLTLQDMNTSVRLLLSILEDNENEVA